MAQTCHENRSRNRARQQNGKICKKVICPFFWGRSGGMSGPGRQSLGRQDEGSALEKLQILREASEVCGVSLARSASRWEAAETLRAFRHPR